MKPRMPAYAPSRMSVGGMVRYMMKYWLARSIATLLIRAALWVVGMLIVMIVLPILFRLLG